jgi:spoIIIJ-associated protein
MSEDVTFEASGETVGEAKWAALRELERRYPGLDRQGVSFQVLAEGERGLMGIGREPARVLATLSEVPSSEQQAAAAARQPAPADPQRSAPRQPVAAPTGPESDSPFAAEVREIMVAVASGLGLEVRVHVAETDEDVTATLSGGDLGVLIGRHGHTIDALQYLVNASTSRADGAKHVTVDAQGYRERREATLREAATRAARDAVRTGGPVALDPMSSVERKIVHLVLKDRTDVETGSEGREPFRHVVVSPRDPEADPGSESAEAPDLDA